MKRVKNVILMLVCLALSSGVFALNDVNPIEETDVLVKTKTDGMNLEVRLANLQQMRTTVSLKSLSEKVDYHRSIIQKHNGYAQNFNLERLPEGRYTLSIENEASTVTMVVKVDREMVLISN